jgi:Flp pilus assembly pilin Flp
MRKILFNLKRMIQDEGAVAAIEFALIVPILTLLLAASVDYGMYIREGMRAQALSRRAAEYVVHGGQEDAVEADIIQTSSFYTDTPVNRTSITYKGETQCECAGGGSVNCLSFCPGRDYLRSYFTVTITAVYTPLLPYPGIMDGVTLTGYSRLQYAR